MTAETYNGWPNRETWAVALHVTNDQGWQESVLEAVKTAAEGVQQDPPSWATDDTDLSALCASAAGEAIRENVESLLTVDGYQETWGEGDGSYPAALARIAQDIGSLYRVDWHELGRVFLSDLSE